MEIPRPGPVPVRTEGVGKPVLVNLELLQQLEDAIAAERTAYGCQRQPWLVPLHWPRGVRIGGVSLSYAHLHDDGWSTQLAYDILLYR